MGNTGIGPFDDQRLQMFNDLILAAWGELGYRVGSSTTRKDWRDVDIRVMLSKEEYARHFGDAWQEGVRHRDPRWRAEMQAWTTLGRALTGLPIDFQVERISEANSRHRDEPRNPLPLTIHDRARPSLAEREVLGDWPA